MLLLTAAWAVPLTGRAGAVALEPVAGLALNATNHTLSNALQPEQQQPRSVAITYINMDARVERLTKMKEQLSALARPMDGEEPLVLGQVRRRAALQLTCPNMTTMGSKCLSRGCSLLPNTTLTKGRRINEAIDVLGFSRMLELELQHIAGLSDQSVCAHFEDPERRAHLLGSYTSHVMALYDFLNSSDQDLLLLLEDDAIVPADTLIQLSSELANAKLPHDWAVVRINTWDAANTADLVEGTDNVFQPTHDNIWKDNMTCSYLGSHAVLFQRSTAQELLDYYTLACGAYSFDACHAPTRLAAAGFVRRHYVLQSPRLPSVDFSSESDGGGRGRCKSLTDEQLGRDFTPMPPFSTHLQDVTNTSEEGVRSQAGRFPRIERLAGNATSKITNPSPPSRTESGVPTVRASMTPAQPPVSVVLPSFSRMDTTLPEVLLQLVRMPVLHDVGAEIIVAHASNESLFAQGRIVETLMSRIASLPADERTRLRISPHGAPKQLRFVDAVAQNAEVGCVHRYMVAAEHAPPNAVVIQVDDDMRPTNALFEAFRDRVAQQPDFPFFNATKAAFPHLFGITRRRCTAGGYSEKYDDHQPFFNMVLTNLAASANALNSRFLVEFESRYKALESSLHGNGCDLTFADFVQRQGGANIPVGTDDVRKYHITINGDGGFRSGYSSNPTHMLERGLMCKCMAMDIMGDSLRDCVQQGLLGASSENHSLDDSATHQKDEQHHVPTWEAVMGQVW